MVEYCEQLAPDCTFPESCVGWGAGGYPCHCSTKREGHVEPHACNHHTWPVEKEVPIPRDTWGVPLSAQSVERLEKMLNLRKLRYLEGTIGEVQVSSHCCDDAAPAVEEKSAYSKARTALFEAIVHYGEASPVGRFGPSQIIEERLADLEAEVDAAAYVEGRRHACSGC